MANQKKKLSDRERALIISKHCCGKTVREISSLLEFPQSTIRSVIKVFQTQSRVEALKRGGCSNKKITEPIKTFIDQELANNSLLSLESIKTLVEAEFTTTVGRSTIHNWLETFNYSFKRIKTIAINSEAPANIQKRKDYVRRFYDILERIADEKIFFVDEVGFSVSMRIKYGRSPIGTAPICRVPALRTRNNSICCALNKIGDVYYKQQTTPFNTPTFNAYFEGLICYLSEKELSGCIFVMDNVPFHKNQQLREMIESNGHTIEFLPPYTPEFNPIENMFSKWKQYVRSNNPQNEEHLNNLINNITGILTAEDSAGYWRNMLREMRKYN